MKHPVKVNLAGRVLVGPKALQDGYVRIVAQKDGSGCIESFNIASRKWFAAPLDVTFGKVWGAPLDKALGTPVTFRNITTVRRLTAMPA